MIDNTSPDLSGIEASLRDQADTAIIRIRGEGASREGNLVQDFVGERLAGNYLWVKALGWMTYVEGRWIDCSEAAVVEVARRFVLRKVQLAAAGGRETEVNTWAQYLDRSKLNNLVALARGMVERHVTDFDTHPHLLNCANCVVDLTNGGRLDHSPDLMFTKSTRVNFNPDASHRDWDKGLEALPEDKRVWLQDRLGQAITGEMTPDDMLVIQQGGGENGKTSVMYGVRQAIGEYYTLVSDRTLLVNPNAHPTELMDLQGARLALIEETPEARQLNVKRLKDVVGTPEIKARKIKKDSVTFPATHSLFLNTNYRLVVTETDHGTWRRLALLVWPYRFRKPQEELETPNDRRGDETLRQRIREDPEVHEAALAWLVRGAVEWYKRNRRMLPLPDSVLVETEAWRAESDALWSYTQEHIVFDRERAVPVSDLVAHFNDWLKNRFGTTWTPQQFKDRFLGHDCVPAFVQNKVVKMAPRVQRAPMSSLTLPVITATSVKAYVGVSFKIEPTEDPN